jgi:hypothetical protein
VARVAITPRVEMPRGEGWHRVKGFHLTSLMYLNLASSQCRAQLENPEWKSAMATPLERTMEILNTQLDVEGWKSSSVQCEHAGTVPRTPRPEWFKQIDRFHIATLTYLNLVAQQIREQVVDADRQAELLSPIERTIEILNQHVEVEGLDKESEAS